MMGINRREFMAAGAGVMIAGATPASQQPM